MRMHALAFQRLLACLLPSSDSGLLVSNALRSSLGGSGKTEAFGGLCGGQSGEAVKRGASEALGAPRH